MTDAGPNYPGTASSDSAGGDGAWSNTSNALTDDGNFATTPGLTGTSSALSLTNYGFSISGTVQGVTAERKGKASSAATGGGGRRIVDNSLTLLGLTTSSNKAKTTVNDRWSTTNGYTNATTNPLSYGGSADLWGNGSITTTQTNNTAFGSKIIVDGNLLDGSEIASVDTIRLTVTYTAAAGGSGLLAYFLSGAMHGGIGGLSGGLMRWAPKRLATLFNGQDWYWGELGIVLPASRLWRWYPVLSQTRHPLSVATGDC